MSTAFSPLEALLLFQYLQIYGVSSAVFNKISDLLKNDAQIRRSNSFDPGRLTPDTLRDFYLKLLKEEAKNELNGSGATDGTNGDSSHSGSRKRKAPSPSLPTVAEASKNAHLIPLLVRKLYARYREHVTIQIKSDERRYEVLRQNIIDIRAGAQDERLRQEIEHGQWDHVIKRKSTREGDAEDDLGPRDVNGAVKPPPLQSRDAVKSEQRSLAPASQATTPALSPRPPQPHPASQPAAASPRQSAQANILPAVRPSQQPTSPHPPPISPRPHSRSSQTPMAPPPAPSHASLPFPTHPHTNNISQPVPPHTPYPPPSAAPLQPPLNASQSSQSTQQQLMYPQYTGTQGGVVLQPFTVAPQTPGGIRQQSHGASDIPHGKPAIPAISSRTGASFSPFDIAKLLSTPIASKRLSLSAAPSPSSETKWKSLSGRAAKSARKSSPERPNSRSVSPISERAPSPPPETSRRTRRGKPLSAVPDSIAPSRRTRRARGGSVTSSIQDSSIRGRTRSQSVMSHGEDVSMADAESVTGRRVKHEPSTPMESSDLPRPTTEGTPNQSSRRGYLGKRKRGIREESEVSDLVPPHPRQDLSVVIAHRNFNRLAQTIMNDIQSHKHASLFSNPVRDKDAEGYSDIIRRPQDLKSIRTAIIAGNRAVNVATASDSFASSTASQSRDGTVVVPVSEDLVPPKAIVNPGQLEKEVMRMFANAVMFNPGDDDVVNDAREMARDVETQIAKFREVERGSVVMPTLSEGGTRMASEADGEEDSQVGKRRKVG